MLSKQFDNELTSLLQKIAIWNSSQVVQINKIEYKIIGY